MTAVRPELSRIVVGVDFDNTIVSYDDLFHRLAVERGLIPAGLPCRKTAVRDHLRRAGQEGVWTALQGDVYGLRMVEAPAFRGVIEFFTRAQRAGLRLYIVSHKTRQPVIGLPHDLHKAARAWLEAHGFFDARCVGLTPGQVFFGATRQEKVNKVAELGCTHFIDDLEETFREVSFPSSVNKILFAPQPPSAIPQDATVLRNWHEIEEYIFADLRR